MSSKLVEEYRQRAEEALTSDNLEEALILVCAKLNQAFPTIHFEKTDEVVEENGDRGFCLLAKMGDEELEFIVGAVRFGSLVEDGLEVFEEGDDLEEMVLCLSQPLILGHFEGLDVEKWQKVIKQYKEWLAEEADVYSLIGQINSEEEELSILVFEWEGLSKRTIEDLPIFILEHLQALQGEDGLLAKFWEMVNHTPVV